MATIREITVSAGRTFNHPYESYSNLKPHVSVTATIDKDDDYFEVVKQLQAQAEGLVEDHKNHMLNSLRELNEITEKQAEVRRLSASIQSAQRRLDAIRESSPGLPSPTEDEIEESMDEHERPF